METTASKFELPPFDPSATFVVAGWPTGYPVQGFVPKRGEIFDKARCGTKLLSTLYDMRWIAMVIAFDPPAEPALTASDTAPGWTAPVANNPPKRKAPRK